MQKENWDSNLIQNNVPFRETAYVTSQRHGDKNNLKEKSKKNVLYERQYIIHRNDGV